MRSAPILAALLFAAPLFPAASGRATVIDVGGNVWRTGQTNSIQTTVNAFQKTAVSTVCAMEDLSPFEGPAPVYCQHAYLIKQDPSGNGTLRYVLSAAASRTAATAITTDSARQCFYLTAATHTRPIFLSRRAYNRLGMPVRSAYTGSGIRHRLPLRPNQCINVAGGDAFVAKFSSDGALMFSTFLGGSRSDVLPPLICSRCGAARFIFPGTTASSNFPTVGAALTPQTAGFFFARLNAGGTSLIYSTYSNSSILAFDVDSMGRAYLTGDFSPPPSSAASGPYVTVVDTAAGAILNSIFLPSVAPKIAGAGVAMAMAMGQDLFLAVSPAPLPPNMFAVTPPFRPLGASYLLELSGDAARVLAETDVANAQFDSLQLDSSGNAYAFGRGTGAIPVAPVQLLALSCSEDGGSFVLESNSAGAIIAATYFRQGDDTAVSLASPGRISFYNTRSSATMQIDLTTQPAANFACPENLASSLVNQGIAPGEIFLLSGAGLGPAQGVGAMPNAAGQVLPTSLGGVQVLFGSQPACLRCSLCRPMRFKCRSAVLAFASDQEPVIQVKVGSQIVASPEVAEYSSDAAIFTLNGQGLPSSTRTARSIPLLIRRAWDRLSRSMPPAPVT